MDHVRRWPVTFEPAGVTAWVDDGATVLDAARAAGVVVAAPCGGRGVCGSCGVRVLNGALRPPDEVERRGLGSTTARVRLACRARVCGPVSVRPMVLDTSCGVDLHAASCDDAAPLVAGVDLGTTSIAAALIDPASGRVIAKAGVANPQQIFGADILSRLSAATEGEGAALRELAESGVVHALTDASRSCEGALARVDRLVIAGNTAMSALLVGAAAASLGVHPFVAPAGCDELPAVSAIRAALAPSAEVIVMPHIAGFVGGDAVAATLAAGLARAASPELLVDFGTNAEVVLAQAGSLIVTSTAAGPAFEGSGISCGGPAAPGAVTKVRIDEAGRVSLTVMGEQPAAWFSGSGLVSAVAALRRLGHVDESGLMRPDGPLADRFDIDDHGVLGVRLGDATDGSLSISQLDIRALQLAKAAVRAGIEAVLLEAGVDAGALDSISVAGAFGSAMDASDLVELGILPAGVENRVRSVGNAALDGATLVALDPGMLGFAGELVRAARHVDLALDPGFTRALVAATQFAPY